MILDTNALSDWLADESAISELISALEEPPILTYVTLAEYRYGIAGSRYRVKIATQLKRLESSLPVYYPDNSTTYHYAKIALTLKAKGKPIPQKDLWISALAKQHDQPVLTQDKHFSSVDGLQVVSWKS